MRKLNPNAPRRENRMYRDLTQGSITKGLLLFAAPMVAGNLLQQLCNIADTLIVGQPLMRIFVQAGETEVLAAGVQYLRIEGAFYAGIGCLFLLYGFYRAVKSPGMSVVLTVISLGAAWRWPMRWQGR